MAWILIIAFIIFMTLFDGWPMFFIMLGLFVLYKAIRYPKDAWITIKWLFYDWIHDLIVKKKKEREHKEWLKTPEGQRFLQVDAEETSKAQKWIDEHPVVRYTVRTRAKTYEHQLAEVNRLHPYADVVSNIGSGIFMVVYFKWDKNRNQEEYDKAVQVYSL